LDIYERKSFDWKIDGYYSRYKECINDQISSYWEPLNLLNIRGLLLICVIIITLAFITLSIEMKIEKKEIKDTSLEKDNTKRKETIYFLISESFNVLKMESVQNPNNENHDIQNPDNHNPNNQNPDQPESRQIKMRTRRKSNINT